PYRQYHELIRFRDGTALCKRPVQSGQSCISVTQYEELYPPMRLIWKSFRSLYFATLLMLLGSGLLSTYLALRLANTVDGLWVGALMAANYLGLVVGGKLGHRLIARVGHIRAYVACAGVVTA